ncbi:hypothetical protein [Chitinophaga pinensis]|uniref:Uncharacterized protein n=1 Tax=Chitinophaga pinensis TaxID=79329 RepID=A0A5C6LNA8_9BACT|nr:hypothetical protein [Chitinophaga pinensis]TWV98944.1 hypothetical protein FEF09_18855 [Chitinophaga pinensis]
MLNENHSNSLPDKMDALDRLPGEAPFNKGAAWDRLQQRMETQAPAKSRMWIWWAAAAMLVTVIMPFLLRHKTSPALPPVKKVVYTPVPGALSAPSSAPSAVVKTIKEIASQQYQAVRIKKQDIIQTDTPGVTPDVAILQPPVEKTIINDDSLLRARTATAATTSKMRVVHINDVGGDVIGNTYINPDHKQFRIGVGGRAGFASQIVSDKSSNNIPKN